MIAPILPYIIRDLLYFSELRQEGFRRAQKKTRNKLLLQVFERNEIQSHLFYQNINFYLPCTPDKNSNVSIYSLQLHWLKLNEAGGACGDTGLLKKCIAAEHAGLNSIKSAQSEKLPSPVLILLIKEKKEILSSIKIMEEMLAQTASEDVISCF